jgi:non-ribosomal peptide synthetase component F
VLQGKAAGQDQVVYGSVVSGRPAGLEGVETMVGLFINVLPVAVRLPSDGQLLPWLQALQASLAELRLHEHTPLAKIREWLGVPQRAPLFESMLAFENYPAASSLVAAHGGSLGWDRVYTAEQWNYPLHAIVIPEDDLVVRLIYDPRRFDDATISGLLEGYRSLLDEWPSRIAP